MLDENESNHTALIKISIILHWRTTIITKDLWIAKKRRAYFLVYIYPCGETVSAAEEKGIFTWHFEKFDSRLLNFEQCFACACVFFFDTTINTSCLPHIISFTISFSISNETGTILIKKLMAFGTLETGRMPFEVGCHPQNVLVMNLRPASNAQTQPPFLCNE